MAEDIAAVNGTGWYGMVARGIAREGRYLCGGIIPGSR